MKFSEIKNYKSLLEVSLGLFGVILLFISPLVVRPGVFSGDEPHYLIAANSIVKLGKLNLREAYEKQMHGENYAGLRFQGIALDHHTVLVDTNTFPPTFLGKWHDYAQGKNHDLQGRALPPVPQNYSEYSARAMGWPILIALGSLCSSLSAEIVSKLLSHFFLLASAIFIFRTCILLKISIGSSLLAALAFSLGSSNWLFANTAFAETALLFYYSSAIFYFLRRQVWPLCLLSIFAVWLKFQLFLPASVFLLCALSRSKIQKSLFPALVFLAGVGGLLWFHLSLYGRIKPPMDWCFGNPIESLWYFFFDPATSIFLRNIWMICIPLACGKMVSVEIDRFELGALGAFFGLAFLPIVFWGYFDGGYCYPDRLIIFVTVPASFLLGFSVESSRTWLRVLLVGLVLLSVVINWKAALTIPELTWKPGWTWLGIF